MRSRQIPFVLTLALILGLQALSAEARKCTIACETDPSIKCSSQTGDCQFYYGAYDYIVCDGTATQCPLPGFLEPAAVLGFDLENRSCASCASNQQECVPAPPR